MKQKTIAIIIMAIASAAVIIAVFVNSNKGYIEQVKNKMKNKQNISKISYGVNIDSSTNDITSAVNQGDRVRFLNNFDKDKIFVAVEPAESNEVQKKVIVKIFNLLSGKIEKQIEIKLERKYYNFVLLRNGFYIIQGNDFIDGNKVIFDIYDKELNLVKTLDLSDLKKEINDTPVLSNDGKKIAYIRRDNKGESIYVCDLNLKDKQKICEAEYSKKEKLCQFNDIAFTDEDKKIAFVGNIYINDDFIPEVFGTVNVNGEGLNYKEHSETNNVIQVSREKTFFSDAAPKPGKHSSGQVICVDNNKNNIDVYNLKDKDESCAAFISSKNKFIITILYGKSQNNEPVYRFRVYSIKSKNMLKEINTTLKGQQYGKCYTQGFCICEDDNSFCAAYKTNKGTKIYKYKIN